MKRVQILSNERSRAVKFLIEKGKVEVTSRFQGLDVDTLKSYLSMDEGDWYNADEVEATYVLGTGNRVGFALSAALLLGSTAMFPFAALPNINSQYFLRTAHFSSCVAYVMAHLSARCYR